MQEHGLHIIRDPAFRIIMVVDLKLLSIDRVKIERFNASLNRFNLALPNKLKEFDCSLVKQSYGRYLFSFTSVSNAVHAALKIRSLYVDFRKTIHPENLHLKIGLSTGDPVTEKNQIFEKAVKLAERITRIISGELTVSAEVRELYNSENPEPLTERDGLFFLTAEDEVWITRFMDYTERHWFDVDLKMDDFNQPTGCSKSRLYRKMVALTSKPPITFIKDYRLDEALILLQKKMVNVSEAAYETGFSSPSYFTRCFQKRFGYSPSGRLNSAFKQELLQVY
jgi:AraC-like DNA-binding protein